MTFGIIGALDEEVRLIRERMQVDKEDEVYGSTFYTGSYAGQKLVVVCGSIGTINAAVCTSVIIREFGADMVVNVGIAGSLCEELHILDVVVSSEVAFHNADLDIIEKYYPFSNKFVADVALSKLCIRAMESIPARNFQYRVGPIASGDRFVADSATKEDIINRLNPLCVEMEGAAVGQVASMCGKPFLIIRTLSDNADESAEESYDNFLELAAQQSAHIILRMIKIYSGQGGEADG